MNAKNPWVEVEEALLRVPRSKRTLQRWVSEGRVRTWRPCRKTLYHLGDLLKVERETGGKGLR